MTRGRVRQELDLLRASAPTGDRLVVAGLGLSITEGPVLGAVDEDGRLHLLVPIDDPAGLRIDRRSPGLTIEPREYTDDLQTVPSGFVLDVACGSAEQNDVFVSFAEEVCTGLEAVPGSGRSLPYNMLEKWRRIFETGRESGIARSRVVGVFGELLLLERIARKSGSTALDYWTGPKGHRHDFTASTVAIEVKTSEVSQAREIEVHGLEQLEAHPGTTLHLAYLRIESTPDGTSASELLAACRIHGVNAYDLATLLADADLAGLETAAEKFRVVESAVFEVDSGFPRLVVSDLKDGSQPLGVTRVSYRVDMSAAPQPSGVSLDDLAGEVSGA